eukprot:32535_1
MCLFTSIRDSFESHAETLQYFSYITFALNTTLLLIFIWELHFLRKVDWYHLPAAFLMVIFSMSSSIVSSSFFVLSNNVQSICSFGPIIAISFRTVSKTFTWALYIIRGQMVMESLDNIFLSKLAKSAPYILALQSIFIITLITIFTETHYIIEKNKCFIFYPLWLLICSALIGECIYGLGFLYIFYKAMSITMSNVFKSLSRKIAENTKKQIRHHIRVYIIQLISSLILLFFVSLCICFQTLIFFEFELFISNLCLLLLFRHKHKLCKKFLYSSKYCYCFNEPETTPTARLRCKSDGFITSRPVFTKQISPSPYSPKLTSGNSNYFFSDKWRSSKEVINMKHALNVHTMPTCAKDNKKVLELMGVKTIENNKEQNDMDVTTRFRTFSMDSVVSIPTRDRIHGGSISSFQGNGNSNINGHNIISDKVTPRIGMHIQSMSDGFTLTTIPSNNNLPNGNPCVGMGIHQKSQSTTDIMNINIKINKQQKQLSKSQHLLKPQYKLNKNKRNIKSKSFMMKFTEFIDRFKKTDIDAYDDSDNVQIENKQKQKQNNNVLFASFDTLNMMNDENKLDNILSLSDPLTSVHHNNNKKKLIKKKGKHTISSSDDLNTKRIENDEIQIDFI